MPGFEILLLINKACELGTDWRVPSAEAGEGVLHTIFFLYGHNGESDATRRVRRPGSARAGPDAPVSPRRRAARVGDPGHGPGRLRFQVR